jgi:hypothetical protein
MISGLILFGLLMVSRQAFPENCVVQHKIEEQGPLWGRVVLAHPGYRDQVLVYDASCSSGMRWMNRE